MRERISIGQAQSELAALSGFHVDLSIPDMLVRVDGRFSEAFVNLSGSPYVILRNRYTQLFIRNVRQVFREADGPLPSYTFLCGSEETAYRVSCGRPS